MKKTLAFAVILLILGCSSTQESVYFSGSFDEAKALAEKQDKPVVINFYSLT
ncbi:MAG: hypothetical protein H8E46_08430 [FCB group bacterium]|nr:hypothetical protein [FCB group bacterium]